MRKFEKLLIENNIIYQSNKNMAFLCSFKAGGNAKYYIEPSSVEELAHVLKLIKENKIKCYIFGNGTNTLVKDEGFNGAVVSLEKLPKCLYKAGNSIIATSNINLFDLNTFAKNNNLKGLEFSFGIPGSVGGAIKMNAGAFGCEISDNLKNVTLLQENKIVKRNKDELNFSYRKSNFTGVVLECEFKLEESTFAEISIKQSEYYNYRKTTQPLEFPSAGSVFKRNGAVIPAKLIDELGLKGMQVGNAQVSIKHAGFVINLGGAKANDIITLIEQIKSIVKNKLCLNLEQEIIVI